MVYHFLKKLYRSPIVIHHSLRKVFIHNLGPLDKESPGMWHRVSAGSCWQALCTHIYAQKPPALFPSLAFTNLGVKLSRSEVGRGLCSLELCMTGLGMVATGWSAPGRRVGIRGPWVSGVSCLSPNPLATWVFSSSCHSANHRLGCTDNRWEGLRLKTIPDEHSLQLHGQPPVHYCNVPSLERWDTFAAGRNIKGEKAKVTDTLFRNTLGLKSIVLPLRLHRQASKRSVVDGAQLCSLHTMEIPFPPPSSSPSQMKIQKNVVLHRRYTLNVWFKLALF